MEQLRPRVPGSVMPPGQTDPARDARGPLDEEAVSEVLDPAVEAESPLLVASITEFEPLALSVTMGYDTLEVLTPEVSGSVRRPAQLAEAFVASMGPPARLSVNARLGR